MTHLQQQAEHNIIPLLVPVRVVGTKHQIQHCMPAGFLLKHLLLTRTAEAVVRVICTLTAQEFIQIILAPQRLVGLYLYHQKQVIHLVAIFISLAVVALAVQ